MITAILNNSYYHIMIAISSNSYYYYILIAISNNSRPRAKEEARMKV